MIFKRIQVKRLKAIREDRTIEFSPGLNIIKAGDNEAGKSSLRMAITKALFQDPNTRREEVVGLTSWGANEPWEVELDIQTESGAYRITKSLKTRSCRMVDIGTSRVITTNKDTITARVADLTGCPSEAFFESTACIGQDELIRIVPNGISKTEQQKTIGTMTQRLQATLGGAESVDVRSMVARLLLKTTRLDARGPYGHLQRINKQMSDLQGQKAAQEDKVGKVMESRRKLNTFKEQLERIEKELPPAEELLHKNKRIIDVEKEIEGARKQYDNFRRARELKAELDRLDEELTRYSGFFGAEEKVKQAEDVSAEGQRLRSQEVGPKAELKAIEGQRPAPWPLISGLILVAGGLLGLLASPYLGIITVAGVFLSGYWFMSWSSWKERVKEAASRVAELEGENRSGDDKLNGIVGSLGFRDYEELLREFKKYGDLMGRRNEVANRLSGVVGDRDWGAFEQENTDLDMQVSARQKELKQFLSFKLEPLELQKLENRVGQLQKQRADLEREKGGLEKFFEYTDVDTDQLASIEENLKWLGQEARFWERKKKVYDVTREALDEAYKQTLSRAASVLEKELGSYISIITDGRYRRVTIDEKDLSIWTFSPENSERVNVLQLSKATQDQFYISARFALVKLITEGKRPPLLLDDPFVNFHQKRLSRMMMLLQELARENQILLFTCSDAYDGCGNVISLD